MIKNAKTFPRHRISIGLFLKNGREKRRRHFPNHAPKKAVKLVKVVSGRKNLVATHTGFAAFTAFFSGRFEKLSVFSRPALSPRREKCLPPHHGPAHSPSVYDTAEHRYR